MIKLFNEGFAKGMSAYGAQKNALGGWPVVGDRVKVIKNKWSSPETFTGTIVENVRGTTSHEYKIKRDDTGKVEYVAHAEVTVIG